MDAYRRYRYLLEGRARTFVGKVVREQRLTEDYSRSSEPLHDDVVELLVMALQTAELAGADLDLEAVVRDAQECFERERVTPASPPGA
jgi:hypothetical protein